MIRVAGIVVIAIAAASGCSRPTSSCAPARSIAGTWAYAGEQEAPLRALLEGTLEVTSESCDGFHGRLDVVQSDPSGASRRLAGPVAGRLTSDGSVRFDAWFSELPRQHVATLNDAEGRGNWVLIAGAAGSETGTFRLTRVP